MPGSLVQTNQGTSFNVTNPSSSAWGGATTTGNHIIVAMVNDSNVVNYITSVTGAGVTTFTRRFSQNGNSELTVWSGTVTSGATTALTFGFSQASATRMVWLAQEWSGIDTTTPYDKASTNATGTSTAPLSGSTGVLAQADSVVFGLASASADPGTVTAGSGYSNKINDGATPTSARFGALESKIVAATTAQTANFTFANSVAWGCIAFAFRASAVSTTASPQPFQGFPPNPVMTSHFW